MPAVSSRKQGGNADFAIRAAFSGSNFGCQRAAVIYKLIPTANFSAPDSQLYITHVLTHVVEHPRSKFDLTHRRGHRLHVLSFSRERQSHQVPLGGLASICMRQHLHNRLAVLLNPTLNAGSHPFTYCNELRCADNAML